MKPHIRCSHSPLNNKRFWFVTAKSVKSLTDTVGLARYTAAQRFCVYLNRKEYS